MASPPQTQDSRYDASFARKIRSRERKIVKLGDEILQARNDAQLTRRHQGQQFRDHLAKCKGTSWRDSMELQRGPDAKLRPCDRQMFVRVVSLMDRDLWAMDPLRACFNRSKGEADAPAPSGLEESGYLVRNNDQVKVETPPPTTNKPLLNDLRHRSFYQVPQKAAGGRHPSTRKDCHHWIQYDNLAQEQRQEALERMERGLHFPAISDPGHVPGCRRAPWKDRPISDENYKRGLKTPGQIMEREDALLNGAGLEQYYQTRGMLEERKRMAQKGSVGY